MPSPVLSPRTVASKDAASDEEDDFILLQPEAGNVQVIPEDTTDAISSFSGDQHRAHAWGAALPASKKRKWVRDITRQKLGEHTEISGTARCKT